MVLVCSRGRGCSVELILWTVALSVLVLVCLGSVSGDVCMASQRHGSRVGGLNDDLQSQGQVSVRGHRFTATRFAILDADSSVEWTLTPIEVVNVPISVFGK